MRNLSFVCFLHLCKNIHWKSEAEKELAQKIVGVQGLKEKKTSVLIDKCRPF